MPYHPPAGSPYRDCPLFGFAFKNFRCLVSTRVLRVTSFLICSMILFPVPHGYIVGSSISMPFHYALATWAFLYASFHVSLIQCNYLFHGSNIGTLLHGTNHKGRKPLPYVCWLLPFPSSSTCRIFTSFYIHFVYFWFMCSSPFWLYLPSFFKIYYCYIKHLLGCFSWFIVTTLCSFLRIHRDEVVFFYIYPLWFAHICGFAHTHFCLLRAFSPFCQTPPLHCKHFLYQVHVVILRFLSLLLFCPTSHFECKPWESLSEFWVMHSYSSWTFPLGRAYPCFIRRLRREHVLEIKYNGLIESGEPVHEQLLKSCRSRPLKLQPCSIRHLVKRKIAVLSSRWRWTPLTPWAIIKCNLFI